MLEKKPTQEQRILKYLEQNGTINRIQALIDIGIFELSARIKGLEKKGYKFDRQRKTNINRFGEKFNCVHYKLVLDN